MFTSKQNLVSQIEPFEKLIFVVMSPKPKKIVLEPQHRIILKIVDKKKLPRNN
jgi:hypothetical protein